MIINLMSQKQGLNRFSKLPDDGDPWASNYLLKQGAKEKHQFNPGLIRVVSVYLKTAMSSDSYQCKHWKVLVTDAKLLT